MRIKSFAKINLGLEVLGKRPDGFHEIRTLFQGIDLHDILDIDVLEEGEIRLSGDDPSIPWDETNLVYQAARLLRERCGVARGAAIRVEKRIPAGGGLGGGSGNAAMTLRALDALWGCGLSRDELKDLAAALGSDAAYFLEGGLCLGEGRGERLTPLPDLPALPLVLAFPGFPVPTALIYRSFDERSSRSGEPGARPLTSGPKDSRINGFLETRKFGRLENELEDTIFSLYPTLLEYKSLFREQGADLSLVTGSGSAVFGLFRDAGAAGRCLEAAKARGVAAAAVTMPRAAGG